MHEEENKDISVMPVAFISSRTSEILVYDLPDNFSSLFAENSVVTDHNFKSSLFGCGGSKEIYNNSGRFMYLVQ